MSAAAANFDSLARCYRLLEYAAFGRDLERARFCLLNELADRRSLLVLGEGDGRCLARLARAAPQAEIHCIDASRAMIARATALVSTTDAGKRIRFECADAVSRNFAPARYDAVVTLFFLDCFDAATAAGLVDRIAVALRPDALWLYADFALPDRGVARWRARAWLALLYTFFRWQTDLRPRALPPAEELICSVGFTPAHVRTRQIGLLRSVLFRRENAS